jgi:hypothetical protein
MFKTRVAASPHWLQCQQHYHISFFMSIFHTYAEDEYSNTISHNQHDRAIAVATSTTSNAGAAKCKLQGEVNAAVAARIIGGPWWTHTGTV